MEVLQTDKSRLLWEETIRFAQDCSWYAGRRLAERMRENTFADWERVFAAVERDRVVGFCVFEAKSGLPEHLSAYGPFINCVYVDEAFRGRRISEKLVRAALDYGKSLGYQTVYLKSEHHGLYEKYGFEKIADFVPVRGLANQLFRIHTGAAEGGEK